MVRVDTRVALLTVMLIILASLVHNARANPGPHVAVPQSPILVGQPIYITYYTDVGDDGQADVAIMSKSSSSDLWHSGWISITGGLAYDITAPGLTDPGTYTAEVVFYKPPCPSPCSSMQYATTPFQIVASTTTTSAGPDWAVLSISFSPANPKVGDLVTFSMMVTALSYSGTFPKQFAAVCQIDGASCGSAILTYPGPVGTPMTVNTQTPWTATFGTHTLTWGVATIPVGQDPNKSNNAMSRTFTISSQVSFSTTTTPEYQNFPHLVLASLVLAIIILAKKTRRLPRPRAA